MALEDLRNQIKELEKELSETKYNKRTQHHIGLVKAKIARLRDQLEQRSSSKGKIGKSYAIKKSGDATVALLGFPSVGKSTLLNALTNANSEVGSYAFTTLDVIPGLLEYKYAKIQILDMPGIIKGAASGKGRGKEVLSALRSSDLILIIIDVFHPDHYNVLLKEIYDSHIRINTKRPDVKIRPTGHGGINILSTVKLRYNKKTFEAVLKEFKVINADVVIREDITIEQFIDCIEDNKVYTKALVVVNKIDLATPEQINLIMKRVNPDLMISAQKKENIDELKELIYNKLDLISIYLKEPGKKPDMKEPLIVRRGSTIGDVAKTLHRDFLEKYRFARIWGKSAKFDGQIMNKLNHVLEDKDILEIHLN